VGSHDTREEDGVWRLRDAYLDHNSERNRPDRHHAVAGHDVVWERTAATLHAQCGHERRTSGTLRERRDDHVAAVRVTDTSDSE